LDKLVETDKLKAQDKTEECKELFQLTSWLILQPILVEKKGTLPLTFGFSIDWKSEEVQNWCVGLCKLMYSFQYEL